MTEARGKRSFWAWGYESNFPSDVARRVLAEQTAALLGLEGARRPVPLPLPTLDEIDIHPPRLRVPEGMDAFVSDSVEERAHHTYGRSYCDIVRGFSGDFRNAPDLVAAPRTEEEIAALLRFCERERVAAIPFGGGTSVVGGVCAEVSDEYQAVLSIDLREMDRVLAVDPISLAARIQAGALGPSLEQQLAAHHLTLRHYPQSFEFSTLGGWIATRAGGHFATLYTHIDDLVESVRMVTPRGVFETKRLPASGAGPSPDRLVLGSEGILGVITEAWMRVRPRPRYRTSASVFFDDFMTGARAARAIAQAALYPSNCRLLDAREAMLNGVPMEGAAVLFIGFESADSPMDAWIRHAISLCEANGGRCLRGPTTRIEEPPSARDENASAPSGGALAPVEAWRKAFLDAPYMQSALISLGVVADTFETACTWDRFEALYHGTMGAVAEVLRRVSGSGLLMCRFTHVYPDGPAPYFTFVAPASEAMRTAISAQARAEASIAYWMEIKRAASEAILAYGGTITHHHAVGRVHRPYYDRERPPLFADALRAAKRALDPTGVLNPGALIDP